MQLHELKQPKGSRKKKKLVGRGPGCGLGKTSGRGHKGQKSRAGRGILRALEGGQMPLQRRVPKKGFTNIFKVKYQVVNVADLQKLVDDKKVEDGIINPVVLYKSGVISKDGAPFKILGNGDLKAKLEIEANSFSESAKNKIESAKGTIKEINN